MSKNLVMNKNENIFKVPEGYFENLQMRLEAIPQQQKTVQEKTVAVPFLKKLAPYAAAAACLAAAFTVGNHFIGSTKTPASELTAQDIYYADIIPVTDPYSIYADNVDYTSQQVSDDDVIEYLISSGTSMDYIAYLLNE